LAPLLYYFHRPSFIHSYNMPNPQYFCALIHLTTSACLIWFVLGATGPVGRDSSFTRFLDHTQRRTTVGSTPLDK
jgi:hypothetical protein